MHNFCFEIIVSGGDLTKLQKVAKSRFRFANQHFSLAKTDGALTNLLKEHMAMAWPYAFLEDCVRAPLFLVHLSRISNNSSNNTELTVTKFHLEPSGAEGTKICSNHPDHMTKMATMPICGKNL